MRRLLPLLLAAALLAGLGAAHKAGGDHELAREAVKRGEILPLKQILERVRAEFDGEMLAVELEEERHDPFEGQLVYEVKVLAQDGAVTELYYDARTGELLKARGPGLEEHGSDGHGEDSRGPGDQDDRHHQDDKNDDGWDWFDD